MLFRNFTTSASVTAKSATRSLGSSATALVTFYLKSLALFIVGMAFFVGRKMSELFASISSAILVNNTKAFRFVKNVSFVAIIIIGLIGGKSLAQSSGDFRSTTSGNWSTSTTWQRYNGSTWDASGAGSNNPGQTPTSTSSVYIQTAHLVTLTADASCKDLHIASSTTSTPNASTLGRIALTSFTLSVNGKMRNYYGTLNTIPGTTQNGGYAIYPFTVTTTGKISIVGTTRTVFVSGEWGATITTASTGAFPLEVNMTDNTQTATFATNVKTTGYTLNTGIVDAGTVSMDNGTTGQGNATVSSGTTHISSATSSAVFQRTGSTSAGTLTLGGTLRITGGTPQIAMSTINFNGTVEYTNAGNQTLLIAISSGANPSAYTNLTLRGSGTKTLALSTTVSGTLTMDGTAINAYNSFTLGFGSSASVVVNTGGQFVLNTGTYGAATNSLTLNPNQVSNPSLSITSANTVTWAGTTVISANSLVASGTSGSLTLSGAISGSGTFTKQNTVGTLILNGTNTYSGATTVSGGTLRLGSTTALGSSSSISVTSGAVLDLNGQTYATSRPLTLNGTGISSGGALINSSATTATYPGLITLGSASSIVGGSGLIALTNTGTITGSGFGLTLSGAFGGSIASIIGTGTGTLTKAGTGSWTVSGANTYTGVTSISAGTLILGSTTAMGSTTSASITSGAVLDLNGITYATSTPLTISGTGISSAGAIINSSATGATYPGLITLGAASSIIGGTGTIAITNVGTISGATFGLTLGGAQGGSVSSIIGTTSGTLTKQDAGTWILNKANTYTGQTSVTGGTLRMGIANAISTSSAVVLSNTSGVVFDLNNFSQSIGSLATGGTTGGNVTLGNATLTTGSNNTTTSYAGAISGSGALTKVGSGTFTLTGTNTYTGLTTASAGTLLLNKTGGTTIPTTNNITVSGGSLRISSNQTVNNFVINATSGTITIDGSRILTINGNYTVGSNIATLVCSGTIAFTGTSNIPSFPGAGITANNGLAGAITNLTLNRTNATNTINISAPGTGLIVTGTLTLTKGIITANGSNPLTVFSTGSLSGGSADSWVSGTLSLPVSTTATFTFPVGYTNGSSIYNYRPVTYQSPSGTPGYFVSFTTIESAWSRTPSDVSTGRYGARYYTIQHASSNAALSLDYNVGITYNGNLADGTPVIINANATTTTNALINSNTTLSTANTGFYTTTGGAGGTYLSNNPAYWLTFNSLYYYLDTVAIVEKAIPLSVTGASVANKQYDGTTDAVVSGGTLVGVQGTDDVTLVTSAIGTFASAGVGTGISVTSNFSVTGTKTSAYQSLPQPTLSANITQATSIVSVSNSGVTYNGTPQAATFTTNPVAGSVSNVLYNGSSTVPTNAGSYTVTVDFTPTDATNYSTLVAASAGSYVINKVTPTVTINNSPVTYTGSAQTATYTTSVPGSISNVLYNGNGTAVNAANYPVTVTFNPTDATNYATLVDEFVGYFLINKVALTFTAGNQIVPYSTAATTVTDDGSFIATGFVNSETVAVITGSVTYTTTYTASTAVGTAGVTITPDVSGLSATNYSFTPANGAITIICNTNTWTGTTSSAWNVGSNWCSGTAPSSGANIILPAGIVTNQPVLAANTEIGDLSIGSDATLDLGGNALTINGAVTGSGQLKGSTTSSLIIASSAGTISFASSNNTIKDLTLFTSSSATLGAALNITAGATPGTVTVGSSATLTTGGYLTLKSDASGTAKVANSAGAITGDVTVERYIPSKAGRYFSFLASPVTQTVFDGWQQQMYVTGVGTGGQTCGSTSGNGGATDKYNSNWFDKTNRDVPSIYTYNATVVNGSRWVSIANTNATNLAPGKGLRVNVRGDRTQGTCADQLNGTSPASPIAVTLKATGVVGQGNTTITLNSISNTLLSLVGNPYPSPIDFATLQLANSGSLYPNMWTLSPSSSGNYTTYNNGVTSGAPSGYSDGLGNTAFIASGQAFFVQSKSAANGGTGSLNFTEGTKTNGVIPNTAFFGTANNQLFRIALANATNSKLDEAVVRFNTKGTNAYDANWDALSLSTANQTLATMKAATKLAIATHPTNLTIDTVQLSLTSTTVDSLQLVFSDYQGIDSSASIILRDKYLGVNHNVRANQVYNFTVTNDAASKGNSRFEVVFTKGGTTLPVNFTAINAVKKEAGVAVNWKVAQPINITKYNVERSIDRVNFTSIATVNATSVTDYTITDSKLPDANVVYYRIQSVEQNGTKAYSAIAQVSLNSKPDVASIYPNPVKDVMNVSINANENTAYSLRILNLAGKEVANTNKAKIATKQFSMNVSNLAGGVYMVEFTNAKGEKSLVKMIKE